jgi:hypothetical protein
VKSYRAYGKLDDPVLTDGDNGFVGIDSYLEPETLQPGFVQESLNMRLDGDRAKVRKGWDFLAATASGPLNTFSYSAGDDEVFATGKYSDPDDDNKDWLVAVTKTKAIIWNESTPNGLTVNYDTGTSPTVVTAQKPMVVQAFNKVYILRLGQRPLEWDGNTAASGTTVTSEFEVLSASASGSGDPFPSTNVGLYSRNRLIGFQPPTVATPTGSKTGAQTIVMSDLLTPNNISSDSEFYLNFGSADYLVGMIPYLENQLLVFLRNSVHCITNIHATSISEHFEITREYGCVAQRSIAQSGAQTYFLSDKGVMVMTPQADPGKGMGIVVSKVQGDAMPLSAKIQDQFADLNVLHAHKAAGVVFDNKYYLSLPTGSDTTPKTIAVYNILQQNWESKDTYPEGIEDWVVLPYGSNPSRARLFATMAKGWFLMEENNGLDDSGREIGDNSQSGTTVVAGKLKTRNYNFGNVSVKKWRGGQVGANVIASDAFNVKINSTDPDITSPVTSYTASGTEDVLIRFGARQRGFSSNVEINTTAGSPEFRHVAIQATANALSSRREVA